MTTEEQAAKAAADKLAADKAAADKLAADEAAKAKAEEDAKKKSTTDEEAKLLREVMDKKAALKEANDKLTAVNEQLKKFEGIDPEKVRALLKQQADAEQQKLEAKGDWERLKSQMVEAHQGELAKVNESVTVISTENMTLKNTIAELTVGNAFGSSKFISEEMALTPSKARIVYGSHFEFKDGKVVGYDKPVGSKERTVLVDGKGEPLAFEAAITKIVEADPDRDQMLKSKLKPGAGSTTTPKGGAPKVEGEKTSRQKIAEGLANFGKKK